MPRVSRREVASSKRLVRMVPGSDRNWIAVDELEQFIPNKKQIMTTQPSQKTMGRSPSRLALLLIPLVFTCFALMPTAQSIVPPPDGCYPNFTTAEGCNALRFLTTGAANTGVGWYALSSDTDASFNTAVGAGALTLNNGESNTAVGAAALLLNTTGARNTAIGTAALVYNDTGTENTAVGWFPLSSNTTGHDNT